MYDALVALHVISAVIGFGAVGVTGVYGGMARRSGEPDGDDETRRYFAGALRAEWVLLIVPFLGLAALLSGPKRHNGGDAWVIASAGLWLIAAGVLIHVVRPAEQRIRAATTIESESGTGSSNPGPPLGAWPAAGSSRSGSSRSGSSRSGWSRSGWSRSGSSRSGSIGAGRRSAARTLMWASLVTDLVFVVALALMVAQPG